jgi:methanogen homocitrate synthase
MSEEKKWYSENYWVGEHNWNDEVRQQFDLPEKVWVHDCTLREAEQFPGIVLKPDEKIALAKVQDELGVSSIETFPVISQQEREVTKEILKLNLNTQLRCLARWLHSDIDAVLECGAKAVVLENTINPWVVKTCYGQSEDEIVKKFVEAVKYAKDNGLEVTAMPWDIGRTPIEFVERVYKAIVFEGGADRVTVSDGIGVMLPWVSPWLVRKLRSWIPGIPVEWHCHNEMGLATSAMLGAVVGGASGVHTTLCGFGTRGGNAPTEEVVVNLELQMGVKTGVRLDKLYSACKLAQDLTKKTVAGNKAIIGDNIFTYSTGLAIDILKSAKQPAEPMPMYP